MCKRVFFCDVTSRSYNFIDTFFYDFQGNAERKRKITKVETNTMAQWMNLHWNNSFVNRMELASLCEKSGAILLVLVGLTTGKQSDEILVDENFLKFSTDDIVRIFKDTMLLLPMHFSQFFG